LETILVPIGTRNRTPISSRPWQSLYRLRYPNHSSILHRYMQVKLHNTYVPIYIKETYTDIYMHAYMYVQKKSLCAYLQKTQIQANTKRRLRETNYSTRSTIDSVFSASKSARRQASKIGAMFIVTFLEIFRSILQGFSN
jgi:hypothetical protein